MFKRLSGIALIGLMLISALAVAAQDAGADVPASATPSATPLPPAVTAALDELNEGRETRLRFGDLAFYEFREVQGEICNSDLAARYFIVELGEIASDKLIEVHVIHVRSSDLRAFECGSGVVTMTPSLTPTPTFTPDLTRTTATPTFTLTYTFTPSLTYTATRTPSATPTFTPSLTPTLTLTPSATLTPTFTLTPSATFTLTPSETPRPDATRCDGFLFSRLQPGEQAYVLSGGLPNRVRTEPSVNGRQLSVIAPESRFDVLEGPVCDDEGRAWWRVRHRGVIGWTIEGQGDSYAVEPLIGVEVEDFAALMATATPTPTPFVPPTLDGPTPTPVTCPGFLTSRLSVGGRGRVTPGDANNVRDTASASGALLGQIPGGGAFIVLDGPVCDPAGRAWWQVDYNGLIGWTIEGQGETYYLEPLTE